MSTPVRPSVRPVAVETIFDLRHRILRAGLPAEAARFERDHDADAIHFGAFDEANRLIGCVSLHTEPINGEAAWRLRGMAVDTAGQGRGVGRLLLEAVEAHVRKAGPPFVWCNARFPAIGFYERCGWTAHGEVYDIPTAGPHRKMTRRLDSTP